jgi:MoxR-like ATPase
MPGLAKTKSILVFSKLLNLDFKRIQFTPDMLPSDVIGGEIFDKKTGEFKTFFGPIFTNLLLADEINRATPKVQSALLEAMQERRVTI